MYTPSLLEATLSFLYNIPSSNWFLILSSRSDIEIDIHHFRPDSLIRLKSTLYASALCITHHYVFLLVLVL